LRQKATVWQSSLAFKPAHQAQVQSEPATPAHGAQWPPADRQGLHPLPAHDGQGGRRSLGDRGFLWREIHDGLGHSAPAFFRALLWHVRIEIYSSLVAHFYAPR